MNKQLREFYEMEELRRRNELLSPYTPMSRYSQLDILNDPDPDKWRNARLDSFHALREYKDRQSDAYAKQKELDLQRQFIFDRDRQQHEYGRQNLSDAAFYRGRDQSNEQAHAWNMQRADNQSRAAAQRAEEEAILNRDKQQQANTLEQQGQQNDFYLNRESLADLRQLTSTAAAQLAQMKLNPEATRQRDKFMRELQLIQGQPSNGKTGARQQAQRLSQWGQAVAEFGFGQHVVQEPTGLELYGKQTFVDPDTGVRMQPDGKGGFAPVFPAGKQVEPPEDPDQKFIDDYMSQTKVFKGRDADGMDLYEAPNYEDALKSLIERDRILQERKQRLANPQAPIQKPRSPEQFRQQTSPLPGQGVVQYAPRDGNYPPAQIDPRQQALQQSGYQGQELDAARRIMAEARQRFPQAQTINDFPEQMRGTIAQAQMILDIAAGRR